MSGMPETQIIGLTGTIGSGKSTVMQILSESMPTTDCDRINAMLLEPGQAGYRKLQEAGLLFTTVPAENPDQENRELLPIDRRRMADAMFTDPEYKRKAEAILHPLILQKLEEWMQKQRDSGQPFAAAEVPLLFELNLQDQFDSVWCVTCSEKTALLRTSRQRKISEEEQKRRRAHQLNDEKKTAMSDVVIFNDGSLEDLRHEIGSRLESLAGQVRPLEADAETACDLL